MDFKPAFDALVRKGQKAASEQRQQPAAPPRPWAEAGHWQELGDVPTVGKVVIHAEAAAVQVAKSEARPEAPVVHLLPPPSAE